MLRKVGATLILVGVFLPFATNCGDPEAPIEFLVQPGDLTEFAWWGLPVLFLLLYTATTLVTPVRKVVTRYRKVTFPLSALGYFGQLIAVCVGLVTELPQEWEVVLALVLAIGLTLPLFIWAWRRHGAAERVPFTLLLAGGSPWLFWFVAVFTDLEYGAYVLLTGLVVCTVTEVQELRRAAPDGEP